MRLRGTANRWIVAALLAVLFIISEKPVDAFINGFDTTLTPPAPNSSLVVEVPTGRRGGISGLVFPYSGGTPFAADDHFGGNNDGNFAWDIDDCAGAKYSVLWNPTGADNTNAGRIRHYGITSCSSNTGNTGTFTENSRTQTNFNVTPFGDLEAVIYMNMSTTGNSGGTNRPLTVEEKTVIRNNSQWFGQTYRMTNTSAANYNEGFYFFDGVDWNFCNSYNNDSSVYYTTGGADTVIGYKTDTGGAARAECHNLRVAGGFSAACTTGGCAPSTVSDVRRCNDYNSIWDDMNANSATGGCPYNGDAGAYLRWNLGTLNAGASRVFPVIWSFQTSNVSVANAQSLVASTIESGMPQRYNASAISLTLSPVKASNRYNALFSPNITFSGTVGLRGFVDADSMQSRITITGPAGCTTALPTNVSVGNVNLSIPSAESAAVPTPYVMPLAGCPAGTYTATLCTNLTNDSTPADNCVSQSFDIVSFLIEPDATLTAAPGATLTYTGNAYRVTAGSARYNFAASASTQGWPSQLWYSGPAVPILCPASPGTPCLIASDTNGDGAWDTIAAGWDTDTNNQPDISVPNGTSAGLFQFKKLIPAGEALGVQDTTVLTGTIVGGVVGGSQSDNMTLISNTTAPTPVTKTLHLHPANQLTTTPDAQTVTSTTDVAANSTLFWQQATAFATPFNILGAGNIVGSMYIGTGGVARTVTFTLLTVGPSGCPANIGSVTPPAINQPTANPAVTNVVFVGIPTLTIPAGCRITLAIANGSATGSITVYHDNQGTGHRSLINFTTTSFVKIVTQGLYTGACPGTTMVSSIAPTGAPGPTGLTACVKITVSDPFGAADIGTAANQAKVTITDPFGSNICYQGVGNPSTNCTRINALAMTLTSSTASTNTYTFAVPIQSHHPTSVSQTAQAKTGTYTVALTAWESNNVTTTRSFTYFVTAATAAKLLSFDGSGYENRIDIRWLTGQEVSTLGYNVYRSDLADRGYVSVNPYLIKGLGYSAVGGSYQYSDSTVSADKGYYYILEEVEESGNTHQYGPIYLETHSGSVAPAVDVTLTNNYLIDLIPPTTLDPQDPWDDLPPVQPEAATLRTEITTPDPVQTPEDRTVDVEIILPDPVWSAATIGPDTYDRLTMAGLDYISPAGSPEIPGATYLIKVPQGTFTGSDITGIDTVAVLGKKLPPVASQGLPASGLNSLAGADTSAPGLATKDAIVYGENAPFPSDIVIVNPPVDIGGQRFVPIQVAGFQWNPISENGLAVQRITAKLHFSDVNETNALPDTDAALERQWSLAGRADAVKVLVQNTGIQQIAGSTLSAAGLQMNGPAANIRCFRKGKEIAIDVVDADVNGTFEDPDGIVFYAENDADEYRMTSAYWCIADSVPGLRPVNVNAQTDLAAAVPAGSYFLSSVNYEQDLQYFDTLDAPGYDHWFWKAISASAGATGSMNTVTVQADDLNTNGPLSAISYQLRGQTTSDTVPVNNHHVRIFVNGTQVDDVMFSGRELASRRVSFSTNLLVAGANTIGFQVIGDRISSGFDTSWMNWVQIIYPRSYVMENGRLDLTTQIAGKYTISNVAGTPVLYDVSNPTRMRKLTGGVAFGGAFEFAVGADAGKLILAAATPSGAYSPQVIANTVSSLNNPQNKADYIAIGPQDFLTAASPLLDYRQREGLWVIRATVDDVMDEFGWGDSNPQAIQTFLQHAYHRFAVQPRYTLLLGDATQDARGITALPPQSPTGQNQVPAYLRDTPYFRAPSDAYFGLITGFDIVPDIAIGRLPGSSVDDITTYVTKILAYEATPMNAAYLSNITLAADNATNHVEDALIRSQTEADVAPVVAGAGLNVTKLYLQDGGSPANRADVTNGILNGLNNGNLFLYYRGHGSTLLWADEQIFRTASPFLPVSASNREDFTSISNSQNLSVVTTFGCLDGNFVNPFIRTIAEIAMNRPDSGVAAYIGSGGLSSPPAQNAAARAFYQAVFKTGLTRLGDAMRAAINSAAGVADSESFLLSWTLFGDPAMRVRVNHAPVISATVPVSWAGNSGIRLDATGTTDPNGDPVSLKWSLIEQPMGTAGVTIRGDTSARALLAQGGPGRYRLRLTATDSWGAVTGSDYTIMVRSLDADSDLDGLTDTVESLIGTLINSADSDGDGIDDLTEVEDVTHPLDTDHDGLIDAMDGDSDGDGILDRTEGVDDTDHDGIPNYRDDDSDGDGNIDRTEGIADADGDEIPNYLDANDVDGPLGDPDFDHLNNAQEVAYSSEPYRSDSDGDGIPDTLEATVTVSGGADIDGYPSGAILAASGALDRDGDGTPDLLDDDSDGDGLLDASEGVMDIDGDGIPNYRDMDSDNDGTPDAPLPSGLANYSDPVTIR